MKTNERRQRAMLAASEALAMARSELENNRPAQANEWLREADKFQRIAMRAHRA